MLFSVIYEIDVPKHGNKISQHQPPHVRNWQRTEGDDLYECQHYGDNWEEDGKHRKYVAVLNEQQFCEFVTECELLAESIETLGCLGALGCGPGIAPSILFRCSDCWPNASISASITPLPETGLEELMVIEMGWKKLRLILIEIFHDSPPNLDKGESIFDDLVNAKYAKFEATTTKTKGI